MATGLLTPGLVDYEDQLTCAVCTEILYQPLTLLDCLHSFCAVCVKAWFQAQATRASSSQTNPFTCPACRKSVRAASSDAKMNSMLEMYLRANPQKARSVEEKKELDSKYTKGEDVLVRRSERRRDRSQDADRRMVEEARDMGSRESSSRDHRQGYERGVRHRQRSRSRRHEEERSSAQNSAHARHIEHQTSLRSLISTEELSQTAMVDEILRQITEEDLLNGIDINNPAQQDELSERIAAAYRRRRGRTSPTTRPVISRAQDHSRSARTPSADSRTRRTSSRPGSSSRTNLLSPTEDSPSSSNSRRHARSVSTTEESRSAHPPVSRPHLLDADSAVGPTRRRRSNESRRQTSPNPRTTPVQQQATRSATDLAQYASARDRSNQNTPRRQDLSQESNVRNERRPRRQSENENRPRPGRLLLSPNSSTTSIPLLTGSDVGPSRSSGTRPAHIELDSLQIASAPTTPRVITPNEPHQPRGESPRTATQEPVLAERPKLFQEVSVKCDRCGREHIEYDLHEYCSVCKEGNYNLCHRCYREGKGCLHWFGYGEYAWYKFQRSTSQQDPPHALVGRRYTRPKASIAQSSNSGPVMTTEEPFTRLQAGAFCSICHSFADDCFWKCDWCNDGEWGFCNQCVNQGRSCGHPLLPLANVSSAKPAASSKSKHGEASFAPITSLSMIQHYPATNIDSTSQYRPLTFSTSCNICHYPIQPSQSRFHCYSCSGGDYDICSNCYAKLVDSGKISRDNSDKGWRRCLKDHRMVKVWFEDSPKGQRRVIVNDLVGGLFWDDNQQHNGGGWVWKEGDQQRSRLLSRRLFDETPSAATAESIMLQKFPPDGGEGLILQAIWPWIPSEEAKDELDFPKGAEIHEGQEISGDWMLGSYAGRKGLFPKNHVQIIGSVTM